jgi:hypothetical protein
MYEMSLIIFKFKNTKEFNFQFNDFYTDPNVLLQIQDYHTFSRMQASLDKCW